MQVTLFCILCELLSLVDLEMLVKVFCTPKKYLQRMRVWYYNFTTTFQLVQSINAEIVTLVCILCELWPLMDLQILDKAYDTVTTTIF